MSPSFIENIRTQLSEKSFLNRDVRPRLCASSLAETQNVVFYPMVTMTKEIPVASDTPQEVLRRLQRLSYLLDNSIPIPGTKYRIGIDALAGLIPVAGDLVMTILSAYIIYEAKRLGAPRRLIAMMGANVALEAFIGIVPVLGDLFDAGWKANLKNVRLLEKFLNESPHRPSGSRSKVIDV
jgi:hypothetical protein